MIRVPIPEVSVLFRNFHERAKIFFLDLPSMEFSGSQEQEKNDAAPEKPLPDKKSYTPLRRKIPL